MAVKLDLDDIQGLIARGYRTLPHALFTIFTARDQAAAHALLSWLLPRVTTAGRFSGDSALHVAYTPAGLRRLGLPGSMLTGFAPQFRSGMTDPNRSRFLGDVGESDPHCWVWGGPQEPPIDGLILLYARSPEVLGARQAELAGQIDAAGVRQVTVLDTLELGNNEPFGFHDGISQPVIQGLPKAKGGPPAGTPGGRVVPAGEFVLGYPNVYGQLTDRPLLPAAGDPRRLLPGIRPAAARPTWDATGVTWSCASSNRTSTASGAMPGRRPGSRTAPRIRRRAPRWPRRWWAGGRAALPWSRRRTGTTPGLATTTTSATTTTTHWGSPARSVRTSAG